MTATTAPRPPVAISGPPPSRRIENSLRWKLVAVAVAIGVIPAISIHWGPTRLSLTNVSLLYGLCAWTGARLVMLTASRRPAFFSAFFMVFCYVFVAVASLAQGLANAFPLDNLDYPQSLITRHVLVLAIGVFSFEIGHRAARLVQDSVVNEPRPARVSPVRLEPSPGRLLIIGLVGVVSVAVFVVRHGVSAFFVSRTQTTAILAGIPVDSQLYLSTDKTASLLTTFLAQVFAFIALYLMLYARRHRLWDPDVLIGRWGWRLVIGLLVASNVIMNNPLGSGRYWFCLIGVCLASLYFPVQRRRNIVAYVVLAVLVLLVAFSSLDYFRDTVRPTTGQSTNSLATDSYPVLQTGLNGETYVDRHGHTDGRQLAGAVLGFVPRSLWPDKPVATGQVIDPQYARSASAWTEMEVDFGPAGVVVFFLLWGALAVVADDRLAERQPGLVPAFLVLLGIYQLFLLRGSMQPALGSLYQFVVLFVLTASVSRRSIDTPEVPAP